MAAVGAKGADTLIAVDIGFTIVSCTRSAINFLGGELGLEGSFGHVGLLSIDVYQPIDRQARWFIEPDLFHNRQSCNVFVDGKPASTLEIKGPGRNFNSTTQLQMDYEYFRGDVTFVSDELPFQIGRNVRIGDLTLQFKYTSVDNFAFPRAAQPQAVGPKCLNPSRSLSKMFGVDCV